jgi:GH25 family lysozyme M1 (1,4-beta-N-acetylmuramidase)
MIFVGRKLPLNLHLPPELATRPLWISDFNGAPENLPQGCRIWQFGTARIDGVDQVADLDVFNGTPRDFATFAVRSAPDAPSHVQVGAKATR